MLSGRLFCQIIAQILWDGCEQFILNSYYEPTMRIRVNRTHFP